MLLEPASNLCVLLSAAVILSLCCTTYLPWRCRLIGTVCAADDCYTITMEMQAYRYSVLVCDLYDYLPAVEI